MDAKRLVPVLRILGHQVVAAGGPAGNRGLGLPADWARRLELEGADGILFQDLDRPDPAGGQGRAGWLREVASALFIPFALEAGFGGWEDLAAALAAGVDRVFLPVGSDALLAAAASRFGRTRVGVAATPPRASLRASPTQWVCSNKGQSVKVGDVVKIVSDDLSAPNSVLNIAKLMNTIPYEFLVKLQPSVRKKII